MQLHATADAVGAFLRTMLT